MPKRLGEHVSDLLLRRDVSDDNAVPVDALPYVVATSVYVFGAIMINGFLLSAMVDMLSTLSSGAPGSEPMKSPSNRASQTP